MTEQKPKGRNPDTIVGGFVRKDPGSKNPVQIETPRPDELTAPVEPAAHPKPWTRLPRNKRTKLAVMGISKDILAEADPRYAQCIRLAKGYRKVRSVELAKIHGYVSSGANALLSSASLALAASRFLYEKVAETGDIELLKKAASLADSARQSELAAWEMSAREGLAKRRLDAANVTAPWMVDGPEGKTKLGRKTDEERHQRSLLPGPTPRAPRGPSIDDILAGKEVPNA